MYYVTVCRWSWARNTDDCHKAGPFATYDDADRAADAEWLRYSYEGEDGRLQGGAAVRVFDSDGYQIDADGRRLLNIRGGPTPDWIAGLPAANA